MKSPSFDLQTFPPRRAALAAMVFAAIVATCAGAQSARAEGIPLTVRYPDADAHVGAVAASFAFGATAPGATVKVNGTPALVAPTGGWIAYVPFSPGRFVLHVSARLGNSSAEVDRAVVVDDGSVAAYPAETAIVQPGDALPLAVTAGAGSSVSASGPGFSNVALTPDSALGPGAFSAAVVARRAAGPALVLYHIVSAAGAASDVASLGSLEIASRRVLFVGNVVAYAPDRESGARPYGMLGPTPDADTTFTVPLGTQLEITGRSGDRLRVGLGDAKPEWIDRREVAPDVGANLPLLARVDATSQTEGRKETTIVVRLKGARAPFQVDESSADARGTIKFFGIADVPFALHQRAFWGYRARWSGSDLVLSFRKPPVFAAAPSTALRGLKVVVDPGHAPDPGAVGPVGTIERDVNLDIASKLAEKLRARGADVVMTRTANEGLPLYDRPALAERLDANVLISVHNNAPPDGVDPSKQHGYSVYYFQPHSLALAQAMHRAYELETDLPDAGLHKGDLALVRTSALPAVLTESAFMTWPWEEMKLRDPSFRDRLATTMADGMERWAERMRAIETGSK